MRCKLTRRSALLCGAALAGCSVLPERPYQERREWPLEVRRAGAPPAAAHGAILLVRAMRAGPGLEARGLRSKLPDGTERIDNWDEWAVPPAQGVEDCLRQWLAASGLFAAVVMPGSEVTADLVLESELLAFVADDPAGVARATISLVLLRRDSNGTRRPVLQQTITGEAPLSGRDGPAIAASLQAALAVLLARVEVALTEERQSLLF
jgi:ABC-type uncharacterized transport system auxiliary subunit